jgi:hypothetical protein
VATAAPSKQASTRRRSSASRGAVVSRNSTSTTLCGGMMLVTSPPCATIALTRARLDSCWRNSPIATRDSVAASPALTPWWGATAACDARPVKVARNRSTACELTPTADRSGPEAGCTISDRALSSHAPASRRSTFPPPCSSAGVPSSTTRSPSSSATAASPIAAPTPAAAIMLCPQACPIPGSASYSAHSVTVRSPSPATASTAVGRPDAPTVTAKPAARRTSATRAAARCSWNAISGSSCRAWLNPSRTSRNSTNRSSAACLVFPVSVISHSPGSGRPTQPVTTPRDRSSVTSSRVYPSSAST